VNVNLTGKAAIVTGAASGIGRACAERLASKGAAVLVTDLQDQKGEEVAKGIREAGGKASFLHHDVTQEAAWIATVAAAQSQFGGLHILVNNAGIGISAPLTEMSFEIWRLQMAVNLDGMFLGMKHSIPLIGRAGGGSIVNISSAAAMKAYPAMSAYCASKAGIRASSRHPPGTIWGRWRAALQDPFRIWTRWRKWPYRLASKDCPMTLWTL
jgi:NAD(P)-dependent dehydrogenase (short-subunit alcohol dehydrogenase family)